MKEPGLDNRHRDQNGRIQQKRSDAFNGNLPNPISTFSDRTTVGQMRADTGKTGLEAIRRAAAKKGK